ncbi:MAG: LysM peptidoglycan-binding domain-containing protein [Parachlamydiaceae bacterium]|nr:LysM peptidoglycan-binding domain-containing protein [Parachlamydiaceae bacterium]
MNRKDTILIAVIINAGLLAILFTTAVVYDTDKEIEQKEFLASVAIPKPTKQEVSSEFIALADTGDEVDNALKYYSQPSNNFTDHSEPPVPIAIQTNAEEEEENPVIIIPKENSYVDVIVKKGDVLDKIARANGTTVSEIKRLNHLQTEKLSIGQKLKIPLKKPTTPVISVQKEQTVEKKDSNSSQAVYYVVKSGDNPWKIAKQFNVKYDDILLLNNLDEAKARNLKIGDRIRVK